MDSVLPVTNPSSLAPPSRIMSNDMEEQPTYSLSWPMIIRIMGLILLFLAFDECSSHFSFDGDNNPESNYTAHFCYSGLFLLLISFLRIRISR